MCVCPLSSEACMSGETAPLSVPSEQPCERCSVFRFYEKYGHCQKNQVRTSVYQLPPRLLTYPMLLTTGARVESLVDARDALVDARDALVDARDALRRSTDEGLRTHSRQSAASSRYRSSTH